VSKNGNAEWLDQRIDESDLMADANREGEFDQRTAVQNAMWEKELQMEEKTSTSFRDACNIF
jgi:hypothetical protein